ncbi:MAG: cell division protein FtsL [Syntrophales bacterium]|jgi:cell division protein FtsL|nr:cell division protein FtsL [Syntrophales bacterium]MDD5231898.1 cell division protein FtsL [Syntrophales bacterium]MDD5532766.1 cell division protein FtsL [Syntrophales bacterium]
MPFTKTIRTRIVFDEQDRSQLKLTTVIFVSFVLMVAILFYVWSHIHFTELKYRIAKEISIREGLLEENRKLKLEIATLKSPKRIEAIARGQLGMQHPDRDQVIFLK